MISTFTCKYKLRNKNIIKEKTKRGERCFNIKNCVHVANSNMMKVSARRSEVAGVGSFKSFKLWAVFD